MLKHGLLLAMLVLAACSTESAVCQGVVECDEETLAFEVAGRVDTVLVDDGQLVEAGTVLLSVDPFALRLAQAEAEAAVHVAQLRHAALAAPARSQEVLVAQAEEQAAQAAADRAEAERRRVVDMAAQGLASDQDRERAIAEATRTAAQHRIQHERLSLLRAGARSEDLAVAQAEVATAIASLERAKERFGRVTIRSPGNRLVRHRHLRVGEVAQPGTPAITLAEVERPYVDAFVPQAKLAALRVGGSATVRIDCRAPATGIIERIGERLEFTPRFLFGPQDRPDLVARVRIRLPPGAGLHAGVPADVIFLP